MGDTTSTIVRFPAKHNRRVVNPHDWWKRPLPTNVVPIRQRAGGTSTAPLPALAYLVLALQEALQTRPRSWKRTGGPDVIGRLADMRTRWAGDREVEAAVSAAMMILFASRRGRI